MKITRHLRISGRVQGVGYRYALSTQALAGAIDGWVRNRRDGTVEAVVQGEPSAVATIIDWAKRGPPAARVVRVDDQDAQGELDRTYSGFEQRPTV